MKTEEIEEIRKEVAKVAHILATPIDFDKLISDGLLKQVGTSYYTDNVHALPENISKKIKTFTPTKKGLKLTFYKETKKMIKLAKDTEHLRDK
ncbi:hypothetical protein Geob_3250 [Geotalea daltonii FRC-32]|uniref:Uncharacterized protein n=1 Tax=Geotalea daltonii (strain DSM 22248 / JCM 15807 / FRC-32) TaxID=316067 RepID=B9M4D8_GEODF|nr:hypothetical protein [Geotalea daltonii]ACM21593.1 hypothetical protein Geob_3250 [Geotalea daltonii FRC-32]